MQKIIVVKIIIIKELTYNDGDRLYKGESELLFCQQLIGVIKRILLSGLKPIWRMYLIFQA